MLSMHFKLFATLLRRGLHALVCSCDMRMEWSSLIYTYIFTEAGKPKNIMLCSLLALLEYLKTCGKLFACIQCFHCNEAPPISKQFYNSKTPPTPK